MPDKEEEALDNHKVARLLVGRFVVDSHISAVGIVPGNGHCYKDRHPDAENTGHAEVCDPVHLDLEVIWGQLLSSVDRSAQVLLEEYQKSILDC